MYLYRLYIFLDITENWHLLLLIIHGTEVPLYTEKSYIPLYISLFIGHIQLVVGNKYNTTIEPILNNISQIFNFMNSFTLSQICIFLLRYSKIPLLLQTPSIIWPQSYSAVCYILLVKRTR